MTVSASAGKDYEKRFVLDERDCLSEWVPE
jgi:hypothetical protein